MTPLGAWLFRWVFADFWVPVWPNLAAGILVAAWVGVKLRATRKLHEEIRDMHERHHAEQMAALDLSTPGGLAAVMSAVQDTKTAAESAHGAVQGLALVAGAGRDAATGKTPMKRAASGRFAPRDGDEG